MTPGSQPALKSRVQFPCVLTYGTPNNFLLNAEYCILKIVPWFVILASPFPFLGRSLLCFVKVLWKISPVILSPVKITLNL